MSCIVTRGADRDHVVGVMRFVHRPMLYVMDVDAPIRAAWVGAFSARLFHKQSL